MGQRRGDVARGGSVRERERRRRDSTVAGQRRAGAPAGAAVVPPRERLRQRARRGLQRSLRARGDGTGTARGEVGQRRAREERSAHAQAQARGLKRATKDEETRSSKSGLTIPFLVGERTRREPAADDETTRHVHLSVSSFRLGLVFPRPRLVRADVPLQRPVSIFRESLVRATGASPRIP